MSNKFDTDTNYNDADDFDEQAELLGDYADWRDEPLDD